MWCFRLFGIFIFMACISSDLAAMQRIRKPCIVFDKKRPLIRIVHPKITKGPPLWPRILGGTAIGAAALYIEWSFLEEQKKIKLVSDFLNENKTNINGFIDYALSQGLNPNHFITEDKKTPLFLAFIQEQTEAAQRLLDIGGFESLWMQSGEYKGYKFLAKKEKNPIPLFLQKKYRIEYHDIFRHIFISKT